MAKTKWCDALYFRAQDHWMALAAQGYLNEAVQALAVMGFVRTTCSRAGSMGRDWFDRKGLTMLWMDRNVLNVGDYTWDPEVFEIILPQVDEAALAATAEPEVAEAAVGCNSGSASAKDGLDDEAAERAEDAAVAKGRKVVQQVLRGEVQVNRIKRMYAASYRALRCISVAD